jgi:hypothetical protein
MIGASAVLIFVQILAHFAPRAEREPGPSFAGLLIWLAILGCAIWYGIGLVRKSRQLRDTSNQPV